VHNLNSHSRDRGCTRPGCTVAGAHCQVHHAVSDWAHDGQTQRRRPHPGLSPRQPQRQTRRLENPKRKDGRTEWIPPPHLDWGQSGSTTTITPRTTYYPTTKTSH